MKLPEPHHITPWNKVYTEAQMRQAIRDAFEEAAKVCDEFECSLVFPAHCANAVRKLKEQIK